MNTNRKIYYHINKIHTKKEKSKPKETKNRIRKLKEWLKTRGAKNLETWRKKGHGDAMKKKAETDRKKPCYTNFDL